jgi:NUMOD4 motif/HNH endonuclease
MANLRRQADMTKPKQDQPATERWLPVAGYEGLYEVSDLGRVRNRHGRILKPLKTQRGYLSVKLPITRGGPVRRYMIHRLVGEAFLGPLPSGMQTRHGPGGKRDNRLVNLSYGTPIENQSDRVRDGTRHRGSAITMAKLTEAVVIECRRRYAAGEFQDVLAREFGVSQQTLSKAIRGVTWRHVPQPVPAARKPAQERRAIAPNVVSARHLVVTLVQAGASTARIEAARSQLAEVSAETQARLARVLLDKSDRVTRPGPTSLP